MAVNGAGIINGRTLVNGAGVVSGRGLLNGRPLSTSGNGLLTSLVGYWKLDEASGQRNDAHTNALHLTDNNTVTQAAGKIADAAQFTSANSEWLSRADNALFDFTTAMSFSIWVYMDSVGAQRHIASRWLYATQGGWAMRLDTSNPAKIEIFIAASLTDGGDNSALTTAGVMSASTWYHLCLVYNGGGSTNADKLKLYVNGTDTALTFTGTIPTSLVNSSADFELGRWPGLAANHWNGREDEAGLWSKSLTQTDVNNLYNSDSGLAYSGFES